jgi:hypothetical protein
VCMRRNQLHQQKATQQLGRKEGAEEGKGEIKIVRNRKRECTRGGTSCIDSRRRSSKEEKNEDSGTQ